jgi:predicted nucleic acid-binding protein
MAYLLDTNVLLRIAQPNHAMHREAKQCVHSLLRRKEAVHIVPQIIFEFWVVATRPVANNGLGLSVEDVKRKVRGAESLFRLMLDTQMIYHEWLRLVGAYSVSGVNAHDARVVAAMKVHQVSHLITFNVEDFRRYHGAEITVATPAEILRSLPAST